MSHIATVDSFDVHEVGTFTFECPVCLRKSENRPNYLFVGVCKHEDCEFNLCEEMFMGDIAKARRLYLGYTRPQLSKVIGKSHHTIKAYEFKKCSLEYYEKLEKLVKEKNEIR